MNAWDNLQAICELDASAAEKALLFVLARHGDDDGVSWCGVPRLAREAGMTERGLRKVLRRLEERGLVADAGRGPNRVKRRRLTLSLNVVPPERGSPLNVGHPEPGSGSTLNDVPVDPERRSPKDPREDPKGRPPPQPLPAGEGLSPLQVAEVIQPAEVAAASLGAFSLAKVVRVRLLQAGRIPSAVRSRDIEVLLPQAAELVDQVGAASAEAEMAQVAAELGLERCDCGGRCDRCREHHGWLPPPELAAL